MEKQIKLKEILLKHADDTIFVNKLDDSDIENFLLAMKEACEQTINLCADTIEAELKSLRDGIKPDDIEVFLLTGSILQNKQLIV